MRAEHMNF